MSVLLVSVKIEEEIKSREKKKADKEKARQEFIKQELDSGKEMEEIEFPEEEPETEEPLPEIYIPETPSPILCGFYSKPGKFWLSLVNLFLILSKCVIRDFNKQMLPSLYHTPKQYDVRCFTPYKYTRN